MLVKIKNLKCGGLKVTTYNNVAFTNDSFTVARFSTLSECIDYIKTIDNSASADNIKSVGTYQFVSNWTNGSFCYKLPVKTKIVISYFNIYNIIDIDNLRSNNVVDLNSIKQIGTVNINLLKSFLTNDNYNEYLCYWDGTQVYTSHFNDLKNSYLYTTILH